MEKYILKYIKSDGIKHNVHPSWYELCEKQTKEKVISILKKHLYEPGEYTLHFYAFKGQIRHKKDQNFFKGWITQKNDTIIGGTLPIGMIYFDYFDDTFAGYDFKNTWPEIDCETELSDPSAKFTVVSEALNPSCKEYEIICKKSAERFMKRLHESVSFPLEIACDYPDVIFEICYDSKPSHDLVEGTLKVIEEYAAKYNKRHDEGIHSVADAKEMIEDRKPNAVYVHVDFGDCNIDVLAFVIKAMGKSNLPIKEMTLK